MESLAPRRRVDQSLAGPVDRARPPAPGFAALEAGSPSALVVDPDPGPRDLVRQLLEPHGFTVHEAADGEEALGLVMARRPWLVVTEVDMPALDGLALCRLLRAHGITRHTPVVFHSRRDDYEQRFLGLTAGGNDYLHKGTAPREMLIRIQLVLQQHLAAPGRPRGGAGLEGEVELVGVPGVLQLCHAGRLSGTCTFVEEGGRAAVLFSRGEVVGAECGRRRGREAVFELLSWSSGRFRFVPAPPTSDPPLCESFALLLLEGCRRLDEDRRETA